MQVWFALLFGCTIFIMVIGAEICFLFNFNGKIAQVFRKGFKNLAIVFICLFVAFCVCEQEDISIQSFLFITLALYLFSLVTIKFIKKSQINIDIFLNKTIEIVLIAGGIIVVFCNIFGIVIFQAPIDENAIQYLPLKKDGVWDKEIKKLGLDTIKKANILLPEAAERVSHSSKCDRIINVMLNSERSKKDDVHIIIDCNNLTRFILNENEIKSKNTPKSLKEKMLAKEYENMSYCETLIKSSLSHPASYNKSFANSGSNVTNLATFVQIAFTAKNGFGLPLEHIAYCEFDDRGILRFDIQN